MARKMRVLYAAAECAPYSSAGGLGEVAGSLPKAISELDIDIRRIVPLHRGTAKKLRYRCSFPVKMGERYQTCIIKYDPEEKEVPTYFVCSDFYFNRDSIYGHFDDGERFLFFCKAVVSFIEETSFRPDIVHINDWHTGMIPLLLKSGGSDVKTVYTIHNIIYDGRIGAEFLDGDGLKAESLFSIGYPGLLSFMRAATINSDAVTTVSRTFAREIKKEAGRKVTGILNGIDTERYDPSRDSEIYANYSSRNAEAKKENKRKLQAEFGLEQREDIPLVGTVARLEDQKGIGILIEAMESAGEDCQFIIHGSGRKDYEEKLSALGLKFPGRIAAVLGYDLPTAKKIYAGSDIYAMPSMYEPGGLGQLIAMRYGTVPVVRSTGGLRDTVIDFDFDRKRGNGFSFDEFSSRELINALKRAAAHYRTPEWGSVMANCMKFDSSWKKSGRKYADLYKEIVQEGRG
jgi:starch synthase